MKATNAWVRATVAMQKSTAAYMTLASDKPAKLLSVSSPVASIVEVHESSSKDGVMQMRAVKSVELPAGKAVELRPGGLHVMLLGLRKPVGEGDKVPLLLSIEDAGGKRSVLEVAAAVRPLGAK